MRVNKLTLTNFRNYKKEEIHFSPERNVIIGENAQGKTNLLEAIEFASTGCSQRTSTESELIYRGCEHVVVEIDFAANGYDQKIVIAVQKRGGKTEKAIKVNGVPKGNRRGLKGHLVTVRFASQDMSLIRGGPKDRRQWIDFLASYLVSGFQTTLNRYEKAVAQRNRLLKSLFEKGRLSGQDIDELKVWDLQLSSMGASIIKQRVKCLNWALPPAERNQEKFSGAKEKLTADYVFHAKSLEEDEEDTVAEGIPQWASRDLDKLGEDEIAQKLLQQYRMRRGEEIARRQTLTGPHRDDIRFSLNEYDATAFGSQGQQRSLVLALKLAELQLVTEHLNEPPVLMLDDVMAELDLRRQGFLMESVDRGMQTLITTTHLDGFEQDWLAGATLISVANGTVEKHETFLPVSV